MEYFNSFCIHTTLHGWQYFAEESFNRLQKLFWGVILFISVLCATLLIYNNVLVFKNATVVTTVDTMTAPLDSIYFPSVTVCNLNQARRSFFEEIGIYSNETLIRQILSEYLLSIMTNVTNCSNFLAMQYKDDLLLMGFAFQLLDRQSLLDGR